MSRGICLFVEQLFLDGVVEVTDDLPPATSEIADAVDWIVRWEPQLHEHLPLSPVEIDQAALAWSVSNFYQTAQLTLFRYLGEAEVQQRLSLDFPISASTANAASIIYSVDLVFRFLPDLYRIVTGINAQDPLLETIKHWGAQWPLSSVGIPDLKLCNCEPLIACRPLLLVYVERILKTQALDRLDRPEVCDEVRVAIGAFPQLSPQLTKALSQSPSSSPSTSMRSN